WPIPEPTPLDQYPFRLFLEITRGQLVFRVGIHDARVPWKGPDFKARAPSEGSFWFFNVPISTYLVWGDEVSEKSICQWLTVILAQRKFLEQDEESECIRAYFGSGNAERNRLASLAYHHVKLHFLQPLAGRPGFSTYFNSVLRGIRAQEAT